MAALKKHHFYRRINMEGVGTLGMWPVKRKKEKEKITDLAEIVPPHHP